MRYAVALRTHVCVFVRFTNRMCVRKQSVVRSPTCRGWHTSTARSEMAWNNSQRRGLNSKTCSSTIASTLCLLVSQKRAARSTRILFLVNVATSIQLVECSRDRMYVCECTSVPFSSLCVLVFGSTVKTLTQSQVKRISILLLHLNSSLGPFQ